MRYHNDIGPAREGRHTVAVVSVPMWNGDVDVDALCSGARGGLQTTLTHWRARKPMKDDMAERFSLLTADSRGRGLSGGNTPW